ncbi:PREDICTED: uncharacterized protein LOC108371109 [Rhagoletis zephyria]|nr:PREDICTED: uncharacterized protein LOC108371109 [Rhagoletis zephyria]
MQSIASKMDLEEELVDKIIDGIPDSSNKISILYGAHSAKELNRRMDRYEQRRSTFSASRSSAKVVARKTTPKSTTAVAGDLTSIRCYNCSQFGHYQSSCPKPTRPAGSRFTCHQMGHQHNNCPKKRSRPTQVAAVSEEISNDDDYLDVKQWSD